MSGYISRYNGRVASFVIVCVFGISGSADAVETDAEKISNLEKRIDQLEAILLRQAGQGSTKANSRSVSKRRTVSQSSNKSNRPVTVESGVSSGNELPAGNAEVSNAVALAGDEGDSTFNELSQEAFIQRDQVPTLKKSKFEISSELVYARNSGTLQSDRAFSFNTSFRYGVTDRFELGLTVPAYYAKRETQIRISNRLARTTRSLGDVVLTGSYLLSNQKANFPGVSVSSSIIFPTGTSPYVFGSNYEAGRNPTDVLSAYQSHGHWGTRASVQFFATVDPVILFFGGGLEYLFSKNVQGHTIDRGVSYTANAGMSMALSEKTTLASSLNFSYSPNFEVNGVPIANTSSESIVLRTNIIQRLGKSFYLEPSVTVGLTDNTGDVIVGLGIRKRF